ncbi:MAG: oxidoreductase, partial [Dermatophilaceae bacterium]|nr:oxidoreductase [Dermatophilaceae bacterium]
MTATSPATRPETAQEPVARPLWWGAVDGVVAGLVTVGLATLAAGALVALGQSSGQPAPIAAVSGAFIDRTPPWLKDFAVSTFGTNDKRALLVGTVVVLALVCAAIGGLATRRLVPALVAFALVGVVGAAAVTTRPGAGPLDVLPTVLGTVAGLWFLSRSATPARTGVVSAANPGRRWLLGGAVGAVTAYLGSYVGGGSSAATVSRDALKSVPVKGTKLVIPAGADLRIPGLTPYIVPNADFYRIDTAIVVPHIDANDWKLKVTGMVDR